MTQDERLSFLFRYLLAERKEYADIQVPEALSEKRRLLRSLMNVRPPVPVSEDFLKIQDVYLTERLAERGIARLGNLKPVQPGLYLWQGGFVPCHGCIDNAIHTYAGVQLRLECFEMIQGQGYEEETGLAKITKAYNLPCRCVLHTVGPIIYGSVTQADRELLANCYRSCLALAAENGLHSIAFCCISTGEFRFPNDLAAQIALQTVREWQKQNPNKIEVIFNVFKDSDYEIYKRLLR